MKLYVEELRRYVIDHGRSKENATVDEIYRAMGHMPNGWQVDSIEQRDDGTAVVLVKVTKREEVEIK